MKRHLIDDDGSASGASKRTEIEDPRGLQTTACSLRPGSSICATLTVQTTPISGYVKDGSTFVSFGGLYYEVKVCPISASESLAPITTITTSDRHYPIEEDALVESPYKIVPARRLPGEFLTSYESTKIMVSSVLKSVEHLMQAWCRAIGQEDFDEVRAGLLHLDATLRR